MKFVCISLSREIKEISYFKAKDKILYVTIQLHIHMDPIDVSRLRNLAHS